eukprot:CAMPEP_0185774092 /NCGR_PEP_ID=MMETSP1174-20130828/76719_1 /TAXON_ID=35687 /ORGANISM="Dictyocha speculum, Strain CCMP1381" /LENGTH=95 /DNA_ID=CAMNT_0028461095 /DNA_START=256 /DNA_END=539 /DNA_ORIENTATION=-
MSAAIPWPLKRFVTCAVSQFQMHTCSDASSQDPANMPHGCWSTLEDAAPHKQDRLRRQQLCSFKRVTSGGRGSAESGSKTVLRRCSDIGSKMTWR